MPEKEIAAVVQNEVVINLIVVERGAHPVFDGVELVRATEHAEIGGRYKDGSFSKRPAPDGAAEPPNQS